MIGHRHHRARRSDRPGGFTLVELLVTIAIIGILAGMVLGALNSARHTAKVAKTKSLIARLDQVIQARYNAYQIRRVPIKTSGMHPKLVAKLRLRAIRELMRMEMPERYQDIIVPSTQSPPVPADENLPVVMTESMILPNGTISGTAEMYRTALARSYFRQYVASPPSDTYHSAEFLYMMITFADPEAREKFRDSDIADVDGDGWFEFIDAWGNPIAFLRWAPGFSDSDVQANIEPLDGSPSMLKKMQVASVNDHDPFDVRNIDMAAVNANGDPIDPEVDPPRGWRLVPLIYSAGPDGIYDINREPGWMFNGSPYYHVNDDGSFPVDPDFNEVFNNAGEPIDSDNISVTTTEDLNGSTDHYDNIHNHRIEQK